MKFLNIYQKNIIFINVNILLKKTIKNAKIFCLNCFFACFYET